MGAIRQVYYNLFSRIYDHIIRLHSRDREGTLRGFITARTRVSEGDKVLDLCTGTGAVAVELARSVGKGGLVVGLDFSSEMLEKAKQKSMKLNLARVVLSGPTPAGYPLKTPHSVASRVPMPSMS